MLEVILQAHVQICRASEEVLPLVIDTKFGCKTGHNSKGKLDGQVALVVDITIVIEVASAFQE